MISIFNKDEIKRNCDEFFTLYLDTEDKIRVMCERKFVHTQEVAKNSIYLAKKLNLDEYDVDLAFTIGYLHDFARFSQALLTQSFIDSDRYNHAHLGAELLFHHNMIGDIIENYDDIPSEDKIVMEKAIYYHGDLILPENLTDREKLFCEIIREADKIDIFRAIVTTGYEKMYSATKEEIAKTNISEEIEATFYKHTTADYTKRKTKADFLLSHQALYFGLNMKEAREKVIKDGYLKELMNIEFTNIKQQQKYLKMQKCLKAEFPA